MKAIEGTFDKEIDVGCGKWQDCKTLGVREYEEI